MHGAGMGLPYALNASWSLTRQDGWPTQSTLELHLFPMINFCTVTWRLRWPMGDRMVLFMIRTVMHPVLMIPNATLSFASERLWVELTLTIVNCFWT